MNSFLIVSTIILLSCSPSHKSEENKKCQEARTPTLYIPNDTASRLAARFMPPKGYTSLFQSKHSFGEYLQNLPLKPMGTQVKYFDGRLKHNRNVYCSVIDMNLDPVDLQQCADAIMRLRGEYLFGQKKYEAIKFNFLSDGKPRYYTDYAKGDYSYTKFRKYMRYIFSYANTASLRAELKKRPIMEMQIGDVFIQKGNPYGHAVIVVNIASSTSGNKIFMLAQSYMPAQDTQILINPNNAALSPWYSLKEGEIITPEWNFTSSDLRKF